MKLALDFKLGTIPEDLNLFTGTGGNNQIFKFATKTPADVINTILPYLFVIAGLILLAMLVGGGFTIFVSTGNPEKIKQGTGMITSALIGFLIMFAAYWILELVQYTLGLSIL